MLEDVGNELCTLARLTLRHAWARWQELGAHFACCDERIAARGGHRQSALDQAATLTNRRWSAEGAWAAVGLEPL